MSELPKRPYIKPEEIADLLGVDRKTVKNWARYKPEVFGLAKTPALPSGEVRIPREAAVTFLKKVNSGEFGYEEDIPQEKPKGRRILSKGV